MSDGDVIAASDRLSAAFAARDLGAALDCFVPGDDIGYAGSELGESATGRPALTALLRAVFARPESYSWRVTSATVRRYDTCAYVLAEAGGLVTTDDGTRSPFAYRVSGLLEPAGSRLGEPAGGRWLWRHCHGTEPTPPS